MPPVSLLHIPTASYLRAPFEPRDDAGQVTVQASGTLDLGDTLQDLTSFARNHPTARDDVSVEIEKLCNATLFIDETFYEIGKKLSDAVNEQNNRADVRDICCALEAQWNEYHLVYQNLLWSSKKFAAEAQCTVDDFREVILTSLRDPDLTNSDKQDIIRDQIEVLQSTAQPSQNLSREFLNFGRKLDKYIIEFSRVVENFGIAEKSKKASELGYKLQGARVAMEAISKELKELGWKFAGEVTVTGISILLSFILPTLWQQLTGATIIGVEFAKIRNSGLRLLDVRRQSDQATKKYGEIKAEYDLETAGLGQMAKLEATLHDARPRVHDVTIKLGIFASVWAAILSDLDILAYGLNTIGNPSSRVFLQRVARYECMYGYLSQALRHYQVTVRMTDDCR